MSEYGKDVDAVVHAVLAGGPEDGATLLGSMEIGRGHAVMIRLLMWCVGQIVRSRIQTIPHDPV